MKRNLSLSFDFCSSFASFFSSLCICFLGQLNISLGKVESDFCHLSNTQYFCGFSPSTAPLINYDFFLCFFPPCTTSVLRAKYVSFRCRRNFQFSLDDTRIHIHVKFLAPSSPSNLPKERRRVQTRNESCCHCSTPSPHQKTQGKLSFQRRSSRLRYLSRRIISNKCFDFFLLAVPSLLGGRRRRAINKTAQFHTI